MAERELQLELTEDAKDLLVDKGWDPSMGARPLRRAIQRYIEDPLADFVLRAQLEPGATVVVEAAPEEERAENEPEVRLSIIEPKKVPATVGGGGDEPESSDDAPAEAEASHGGSDGE
jgi:ATP-dependent Clp protease ATP-binding subunit ClpC